MYLLKLLIEKWEHRAAASNPVPDGLSECLREAKQELTKAYERSKLYSLDMEIIFGKYKGDAIWKIIDRDPGYVTWCLTNIDGFTLDETAHNYLIEKEQAHEQRKY